MKLGLSVTNMTMDGAESIVFFELKVMNYYDDELLEEEAKSDDVWQYFTRIKTKDPDVVYAACHRCDRCSRLIPSIKALLNSEDTLILRHAHAATIHRPLPKTRKSYVSSV